MSNYGTLSGDYDAGYEDGLKAVAQLASLARTALSDPSGLPTTEVTPDMDVQINYAEFSRQCNGDWDVEPDPLTAYAIDKLDEIINALDPPEPLDD